jgi:hypothetical protein
MKIFVADGGNKIRREYCLLHDIGFLYDPRYYCTPPKGASFILDNGAFAAWKRGEEWDETPFYALLTRIAESDLTPYAVIVPDIVAGGVASLRHSASHISRVPEGIPRYLPVQDGMAPSDVLPYIEDVEGLFVGGSVRWKWRTAQVWAELAHGFGKLCHIGRVGNRRTYAMSVAAGADSVDGSTPMRHNKLHVIPKFRETNLQQKKLLEKEVWMSSIGEALCASRDVRRGEDDA